MKRRNAPAFLLYCALFSALLAVALWGLCYALQVDFPLYLMLLVFFISFALSFLFFNFFYEKVIFGRIDETLSRLRQFRPESAEKVDFVSDVSDPIERFNEEIIHLSNERQKEVEHLKKLENYRKEFLGNVSHELKTPIFNIQGYISTLIDGGISDPKINMDYLKRADKSVDRMIHIIDDLETISQLESGTLSLEIENYNVVEQIHDIISQIEIMAAKKNVGIRVSAPEKMKVRADRFRIRQVFANLITNSIKYGRDGGETIVTVLDEKERVKITISDNGIGIEEKHLPRLFERFYRVDKGRSREQGGTGLGLSIVKHIIEAHDQTISVSSEFGKGTTFEFTLPRA
jgi:two-component system, OmpR family, phosphate regulon sensor histidine kinase PhoR